MQCPNLAKIHMVAKQFTYQTMYLIRPNLAKIHMVAKLRRYIGISV